MKRVLVIMGTRPEAIKLAPVIKELASRGIDHWVLATGQHDKDIISMALEPFNLKADSFQNGPHMESTQADWLSHIVSSVERFIMWKRSELGWWPDTIIVHGDTTSCLAGALVGFYHRIPVAHVEAGIRSFSLYNPWPEEVHRTWVDNVATYHFCPTDEDKSNLLGRGKWPAGVRMPYVTGNTIVDAVKQICPPRETSYQQVLVSVHRKENKPHLQDILGAIRKVASDNFDWTFAVLNHPHPDIQRAIRVSGSTTLQNVKLQPPIGYAEFLPLVAESAFLITDSGGLQEEASVYRKPVVITREFTERTELIRAGGAICVGHDRDEIARTAQAIIDGDMTYPDSAVDLFGDGHAAKKIVDILCEDGGCE